MTRLMHARWRMTWRKALGLAALVLAACAVTVSTPVGVRAHGDVDVTLANGPRCNSFDLPVAVTQAGGQRQEFVPSQPGLSSVGLCTSPVSGPTSIDIVVREGSAASPGEVVGGGTAVVNSTGFNHVDFLDVIPVETNETYVIELVSSLPVTWHGTGPFDDVYLYEDGESNMPGVVQDFGFRTYSGPVPGTPEPSATRTGTPTRTRTATTTPTLSSTATPAATVTPVPAAASATAAPAEPTIAATGATPLAQATVRAAATATRTSGVLGGARRTGTIKLPDVGGGGAGGGGAGLLVVGAPLLVAGLFGVWWGKRTRRTRRGRVGGR